MASWVVALEVGVQLEWVGWLIGFGWLLSVQIQDRKR